MAKHDIDPVLQQLTQAINESGQAAVPLAVSVRGTAAWHGPTAGFPGEKDG